MARISGVKIAAADNSSKGVVIDGIITEPSITSLINQGVVFCLKPLEPNPAGTKTTSTDVFFDEANDIMSGGLKLMPLVGIPAFTGASESAVQKEAVDNATSIIDLLNLAGLPYGVTVWIDMKALSDNANTKLCAAYIAAWSSELSKSKYGVGQYSTQAQACCTCPGTAPQESNGEVKLELFQCPDGNTTNSYPEVTISQSSNEACQIYWALTA